MNILNKRSFKETQSRILILGEINEENTNNTIADILDINDIDRKIKKEKREPIQLILSSEGGEIYRGLGLVDVILNSETPIYTICYGLAMSMAFIILVAGHNRIISKRSTLMYHEGGFDLGSIKLTGHKFELNELERIEKICDDLVLERTKINIRQLKHIKKQQKEWYIKPDEALRLGIVDKII